MRAVAALLLLLITVQPARAFDCTGVTLPSSIVICSDPELMRIADERQQAVNEARARLPEPQFKQLMADQNAWIRAYATACGVPPDAGLPELPVTSSVKACFKKAGEARTAYIRSYGQQGDGIASPSPVQAMQDRIGPGFDCGKAKAPLAQLICADLELSRVDLAFNQVYWALYQDSEESERQELKQEDAQFLEGVVTRCNLPRSGDLAPEGLQTRECVKQAYERQRADWLRDLSGAAREEATRQLGVHIALERKLRELGFLTTSPIPEGVYGPGTRAAIIQWQTARGRNATGFLSDADAQLLASLPSAPLASPDRSQNLGPQPLARPDATRTEVPLELDHGTYRVPVRINDQLTLKFIIDTGASDVVIPADVVLTLIRTGTIGESDFIGEQSYMMADGSVSKNAQFAIHKLQVGDIVLSDVRGSVGDPRGTPLLGQTFLRRFDSVMQDNKRQVLVLAR